LPFFNFWYGICFFRTSFMGYKESKIFIHYKGGCTMKTKLPIIAIAAILVSACTTGTYMTRAYSDDIYFSPGDVPPVAAVENEVPVMEKSANMNNPDARNQKGIMNQTEKNANGSAVSNYVYQPDNQGVNQDNQAYNMGNQDLVQSDTTVYYNDDSIKYVINNYYDENNNDMDFAYRIGRFHNPYYYSPFYDDWNYGFNSPWNSGFYGMNYGWGYDPFYSYGWGYPYGGYYGYSPFALGFGGYWGGGYGGYGGYYGGGGFYNGHNRDRNNVRYGRSSDFSNYAIGGKSNNNSASTINRSVLTQKSGSINQLNTGTRNENLRSQNQTSGSIRNSGTSFNGRRSSTTINSQVQGNGQTRTLQMVRPGTTSSSGNVRRVYEPSTTGKTYNQGNLVRQSQNYVPSYNKPRIVNQSNYNSNSYTRPRTSYGNNTTVRSGNSMGQGSTYSQPRSSSSMRQTYRSSSSYSNGSSSSPTRSSSSYSSPSSGSGSSYSAPSRSSSGSSYSGGNSGGGGSGGSSGGSSGGGSGGRSGSGGRR
jgi:hypothetical protein